MNYLHIVDNYDLLSHNTSTHHVTVLTMAIFRPIHKPIPTHFTITYTCTTSYHFIQKMTASDTTFHLLVK